MARASPQARKPASRGVAEYESCKSRAAYRAGPTVAVRCAWVERPGIGEVRSVARETRGAWRVVPVLVLVPFYVRMRVRTYCAPVHLQGGAGRGGGGAAPRGTAAETVARASEDRCAAAQVGRPRASLLRQRLCRRAVRQSV